MSKYIFIYVNKQRRMVWVVFRTQKEVRDNDSETSLKEGGVIEIETTSIYTMHALPFAFCIYPPMFDTWFFFEIYFFFLDRLPILLNTVASHCTCKGSSRQDARCRCREEK